MADLQSLSQKTETAQPNYLLRAGIMLLSLIVLALLIIFFGSLGYLSNHFVLISLILAVLFSPLLIILAIAKK